MSRFGFGYEGGYDPERGWWYREIPPDDLPKLTVVVLPPGTPILRGEEARRYMNEAARAYHARQSSKRCGCGMLLWYRAEFLEGRCYWCCPRIAPGRLTLWEKVARFFRSVAR